MKLTIIVPVYNKEIFLDECIKSILNQTKKDIELILVDDGSTDSSGKICDEWKRRDERVRVIHKENEGILLARIAGVKNCKTEYLTFVDADDFVDKESFILAEEFMGKDIDIICFGISRYFDEKYSIKQPCRYKPGIYNKERIKGEIIPTMIWDNSSGNLGLDASICIKVIRKELLQKVVDSYSDFRLDICEDRALSYPCVYYAGSLAVSDRIYYNHRQRSRNDIAPYIASEDYYDKLYNLYCRFKSFFKEDKQVIFQIEQWYSEYVQKKTDMMRQNDKYIRFLFPFNEVRKDSRIVLYGAGKVGRDYYKQLIALSFCKEIYWVDKEWNTIRDERVSSPDDVYSKDADYVVIAIKSKDAREQITKELIDHGILKRKIVVADWKDE